MKKYLKALSLLVFIMGINLSFADQWYVYKSDLFEIEMRKPVSKDNGIIEGEAKISLMTKEGKGVFSCYVQVERNSKKGTNEFDNVPKNIKNIQDCNPKDKIILGNLVLFVKKFSLSGNGERVVQMSLYQSKFNLDINGVNLTTPEFEDLILSYDKDSNKCLNLLPYGSKKISLNLGKKVKYGQAQFRFEPGQVIILSNESNVPQSLKWKRVGDLCSTFQLMEVHPGKAKDYDIK